MEKVLIIGVNITKESKSFQDEISELISLCEACEMEVIETAIQNLNTTNTHSYVGKGKLEEIKVMAESLEIEALVFNDELKPLQVANISKVIDLPIYDRTYIILEIFRRRAKTKEAMLQVEIATLKYQLPRLVGLHSHLSRQRGTGGGFAHGRGQGETKLELDKRNIYDRIADLNKELADLTNLRQQQRARRKRNQMKIVSLVGYTNSGKSSTLNGLLDHSIHEKKEVFEKDMLFATLETSTRLIKTQHNLQFLLTDTVGFINKLPHHLVEAFKSTLEEITESNMIIHVVDSSNLNFENQIKITNEVLTEIGVKNIPTLYAFNKIDLHEDYFYIPKQFPNAIRISATKNINLDKLLNLIEEELFKTFHQVKLFIPYHQSHLINQIKENAIIQQFTQQEEYYYIEAKVSDHLYEILKEFQQTL